MMDRRSGTPQGIEAGRGVRRPPSERRVHQDEHDLDVRWGPPVTAEPGIDRALAGIGEELQASAPDLAHALDAFDRPRARRWWIPALLALGGAVAVVAEFGMRGALYLSFAVVLAAPLCVAFVFCDGPPPVEELPPPDR
jgi:hypothetical protein